MLNLIRRRAAFFARIRGFFAERGVLEVDTPLLSAYGVSDVNLRSLAVEDQGYLVTSPEYAMKRLLAASSGDIYQLSHVFRGEEAGRKHACEFSLLEWYRTGWDERQLSVEVVALVHCLYPLSRDWSVRYSTYAQLFLRYLSLDIFQSDDGEILACCARAFPESRDWNLSRDGALDLLFTHQIEPFLGRDSLEFVCEYPPSQAALAKVISDQQGRPVAARFELYIAGVELCNGFCELSDPVEQRMRFEQDNRERMALGLPEMRLDEPFLAALEKGLPECAGVALGVDRLLMLVCGKDSIAQVMY